jgi:hypothetical protein
MKNTTTNFKKKTSFKPLNNRIVNYLKMKNRACSVVIGIDLYCFDYNGYHWDLWNIQKGTVVEKTPNSGQMETSRLISTNAIGISLRFPARQLIVLTNVHQRPIKT